MAYGYKAAFVTLNKTMKVTISNRGLAAGIMSRIDKRGKVYHTIDGRRHETYSEARQHQHRLNA